MTFAYNISNLYIAFKDAALGRPANDDIHGTIIPDTSDVSIATTAPTDIHLKNHAVIWRVPIPFFPDDRELQDLI
jgi:hypothetical protein